MTKARDLSLAAKAPLASPVFSGNVGVGVTPEAWHSNLTALQIGATVSLSEYNDGSNIITLLGSNNYYDGNYKYLTTNKAALQKQINGTHVFEVAASGSADAAISWTTAMSIDNGGRVSIYDTGDTYKKTAARLYVTSNAGANNGAVALELGVEGTATSTRYLASFTNNNGIVGHISVNGSATAYNTSSDYRLKENVTPMSGAIAQTKLLKPCNFDWIAGGNVNGFIAHELAEVVPEAVTGTKDAMMDEEYEVTPATDTEAAVMGTRSVPDLQGIDQSKLVPLLTATIQELIARIEALEA